MKTSYEGLAFQRFPLIKKVLEEFLKKSNFVLLENLPISGKVSNKIIREFVANKKVD